MPDQPDATDEAATAIRKRLATVDRSDKKTIEQSAAFAPKFDTAGLITAIAVDADHGTVLMVAYMNEESLAQTLAIGEAVYFSRSRQKLWHKGATSGHTQKVIEVLTDCDQDALVLRVRQKGPGCCHAGFAACFYRSVSLDDARSTGELKLNQVAEQTYDPNAVYG